MINSGRKRPGLGLGLRVGAQLASALLLVLAASPAAASVEFVETTVAGGDLVVDLAFDSAMAPGQTFELRYLAADGTLLDSQPFAAPPGGELEVLLDGHYLGLGSRGWQHRLEVVDAAAQTVTGLDLRLRLKCDDTGYCEVQDLPGLEVLNAVGLQAELAPYLSPGKSIDLPALVAGDPRQVGPSMEFTLDLLAQLAHAQDGCACFYAFDVPRSGGRSKSDVSSSADAQPADSPVWISYSPAQIFADSQRFEVGDTQVSQIEMSFHCYSVASLVSAQATISEGLIWSDLAVLEPCPTGCPSPVDWQLGDLRFDTRLDPGGGAAARTDYAYNWNVDGSTAFSFSSFFTASGLGTSPLDLDGLVAVPAGLGGQPTPSMSEVKLETSVEISGWTPILLPAAEMALEASHTATGTATCAPNTQVTHSLMRVNGDGKTTLTVVLGPDDP